MDYSERDYIRAADAKGRGLTRMSVLFCCSIKSAGIWEIRSVPVPGICLEWCSAERNRTMGTNKTKKKWKELGIDALFDFGGRVFAGSGRLVFY